MHHELVLVYQSQLRQRQRERHAANEQSLARLLLELLDGLPQIAAHELRVPVDPFQSARHDVLLRRIDRPGEGLRPRRHLWRRPPPRSLHHFVDHPAEEEGIGLREARGRVTMQVFVRGNRTMIAAPVQCDVDRIPKGSHCIRVPAMGFTSNDALHPRPLALTRFGLASPAR
jgi:hypothetical protein